MLDIRLSRFDVLLQLLTEHYVLHGGLFLFARAPLLRYCSAEEVSPLSLSVPE